jgi:hypothetical protein
MSPAARHIGGAMHIAHTGRHIARLHVTVLHVVRLRIADIPCAGALAWTLTLLIRSVFAREVGWHVLVVHSGFGLVVSGFVAGRVRLRVIAYDTHGGAMASWFWVDVAVSQNLYSLADIRGSSLRSLG